MMEKDVQSSSASHEAIESAEKLYNAIQTPFPDAVADFESKWTALRAVAPPQMNSTSIDAYVGTDEFEALKRLGPKIIPFVVFKLAKGAEQDSIGVFLYNAIESDPDYRVDLNEAPVSQEVLWRHGSRIVEFNYHRNKIVEDRLRAWKEHCLENQVQSATAVFTFCDEYEDLLEMGPSIIAHLMVEYYDNCGGSWHELVHEIIHGRKMGAYMIQKADLCYIWCMWFDRGEHNQAYKYIPTPMDHYIYTGEVLPGLDPVR